VFALIKGRRVKWNSDREAEKTGSKGEKKGGVKILLSSGEGRTRKKKFVTYSKGEEG